MKRRTVLAACLVTACGTAPTLDTVPTKSDGSASAIETASIAPGASSDGAPLTQGTSSATPVDAMSSAAAVPPETPPPGFVPIPERRASGFPGTKFTEVRGFAFDLEVRERPVCARPLDPDGTLCSTVVGPGVKLTPEQAKELVGMLGKKSTFGGGSSCFLPHHGFVFYDGETPVAELSVCFLCDVGRSSPAVPAAGGREFGVSEKSIGALRKLCSDLGLPKCDARQPEEFGKP